MNILRHKLEKVEGDPAGSGGGPAPASPPASGSSEPGVDFGAMSDKDYGSEPADSGTPADGGAPTVTPTATPSGTGAAPTAAPSAPATPGNITPAAAPTAAPAAPVQSPPTPGQPAAQPAAVAPAPAPASPAAPAPAPAAPAAAAPVAPSGEPVNFEQHRKEFLPKLEQLYKLTEQEAEEVRTSPDVALPKLAAKLHYEVTLSAYNSVISILPQLTAMVLDQRAESDRWDKAFYDKFSVLKDEKYTETVRSSVKAARAANPKATPEQVINQAGLMAMITLGIPLEGFAGVGAPTPAAPPAGAPPAPVVPAAPRPAGAGASGHVPPRSPGEAPNIIDEIFDFARSGG